MKHIYPSLIIKSFHIPLKSMIVFLGFFLWFVTGTIAQDLVLVWNQDMPGDITAECSAIPAAPDNITASNTDLYSDCYGDVPVVYMEVRTDGTCPNSYTLSRIWTATDNCDNVTSHTQTITVQDTTTPLWTTTAGDLDRTVQCSDADALAAAQALFPVATDNCDIDVTNIVKVSGSFVPGTDCSQNGTITNTWTVTDDCGNTSAVYTQLITIVDATAPTWVTEAGALDRTVECSDADALAAAQALFPVATDNCDADVTNIVKVSGSFVPGTDCSQAGTITNTWTVTDDCGNTSAVYTQLITIVDTTAPTWVTTAGALNRTVECSDAAALTSAQALFPVATDNCDADVTNIVKVSGSFVPGTDCSQAGTITNTWTVTDDCGNTSAVFTQVITLQDTTDPVFVEVLPVSVTVECDAVPEATVLTATDNCDTNVIVIFTETRTDGTCPDSYILTRTWTATDDCGNSITHIQVITMEDTTAPLIEGTIADIEITGCDVSVVPVFVSVSELEALGFTITDNCTDSSDLIVSYNDVIVGSCPTLLTRTYTITDACGNWESIDVKYNITAPLVELTVPANYNGTTCMTQDAVNTAFTNWLNQASFTGGCGGVLTRVPENPTAPPFCGGSVEVTWTVTSECEEEDVVEPRTFTIPNAPAVVLTVPDPEPIPSCDYLTHDPECYKYAQDAFDSWLAKATFSGGCNAKLTITPDPLLAPGGLGGSTTVTWTVTSDCQDVITLSSTFSVEVSGLLYQGPEMDGLYDGRGTAYVTKNTGFGTMAVPHNWLNNNPNAWIWGLQNGQDIGNPPKPDSRKNDVYFQISSEDFIKVKSLKVQNNVTLVVCGYLEIGDFESEDGGGTLNNVKIVVCKTGTLKATRLLLYNNVLIVNNGLMQVDQISGFNQGGQEGSSSPQCIQGTGTFQDTKGNTIIHHDTSNDPDVWYADENHVNVINDGIQGWQFGENCDDPVIGILPIELLSFTSEIKPDRIDLLWATGSEINNDYFTIERSRDLNGWEILGFMEGAGNSSVPLDYSFSDLKPLDGLAYYRLKQTDFDGKFKYYGPIPAHYDLGLEGLEFKVLKQFSNWIIAVPQDGVYQVEVYTLTGRRLVSEKVENNLSIPAPEGGVVIRVTDGFARSASRVVM